SRIDQHGCKDFSKRLRQGGTQLAGGSTRAEGLRKEDFSNCHRKCKCIGSRWSNPPSPLNFRWKITRRASGNGIFAGCQTKVDESDFVAQATVDMDIVWFEISMTEPPGVKLLES